jgi:predicted MPP superfamily phosphohydrolase
MGKKSQALAEAAKNGKDKPRFLSVFARILIILLVLAVGAGSAVFFYARYTKTHYTITFYQETSKKLSQSIRLAVISDIHNREYGEGNAKLISDISTLKPDLILFLGDMITKTDDHYEPMLNLISNLSQIAPCYGVLGNHESERIYYYDDRQLPDRFRNAGLNLLRNAQETIRIGADNIQLIGLEGTVYGFDEYGGRAFMDNVNFDSSAYCIVMNHIPILFDSKLSAYSYDLGIAGHVHGGIINLPFIGGLFSDEEGYFPRYYAGEYTVDGQKTLIISRGMGDSRPIPRINNMPVLVIIDISGY